MNRLAEMAGPTQVRRLEEALIDLQDLAAAVGRGEAEHEKVVWRLRHYLIVVELVLREFAKASSLDGKAVNAVTLLREVKGLVSELIEDLSNQGPCIEEGSGSGAESSSRPVCAGGQANALWIRSWMHASVAHRRSLQAGLRFSENCFKRPM